MRMKGERITKHIAELPTTMLDKQLVGLFQQSHPPQQQASCFDLKYTISDNKMMQMMFVCRLVVSCLESSRCFCPKGAY